MNYTKVCTVCQEELPATIKYFNKEKLGKYGITSQCKKCKNLYSNEYYSKNKKRYARNRKNNKLKKSEYDKKRYQKNRDKIKNRTKQYYYSNQTKVMKYWRNRYRKNLNFRITMILRKRVRSVIKNTNTKKYYSSMELVGCSIDQLKKHLEKQFVKGMSWKNYGFYGWHIDHIMPCSSFDMSDPEQQKKCFHYTNLQPLWAEDNLRKSNKIL